MSASTSTALHRSLRWLAWLPLGIALANAVAVVSLRSASVCAPLYQGLEKWNWLAPSLSAAGFGAIGGLIMIRQPHNRIGWLCGAIAVATVLLMIPNSYLDCAYRGLIDLPGLDYLTLFSHLGLLLVTLEFLLLPLIFPDGHFLSSGWRRFAVVVYAVLFLVILLSIVWPGNLLGYRTIDGTEIENPFGLPFQPSPGLTILVDVSRFVILIGGILTANFSLFARWRRSGGLARQQLKVLAYFLVTIGTVFMLFQLLSLLLVRLQGVDIIDMWGVWIYNILLLLMWGGFPLAVGVAVLKYRLYDIDIVIRKTLVYTLLTASLALLYFGGVTLLQGLFQAFSGQQSAISIVVSTLAIAALFNPLRRRVQEFIDRRFYRKKYDAERALARFAAVVRDETDIEQLSVELLTMVRETIQPEHTSLWLKKIERSGDTSASYPNPSEFSRSQTAISSKETND